MNSIDSLVINRRELTSADEQLSKGLSMLASCEENTSLARILSKLAETHENLAMIEKHMYEQDSAILLESVQVRILYPTVLLCFVFRNIWL